MIRMKKGWMDDGREDERTKEEGRGKKEVGKKVGWMSSLTGTDETLTCKGYCGTFITLWRA